MHFSIVSNLINEYEVIVPNSVQSAIRTGQSRSHWDVTDTDRTTRRSG